MFAYVRVRAQGTYAYVHGGAKRTYAYVHGCTYAYVLGYYKVYGMLLDLYHFSAFFYNTFKTLHSFYIE